MSRRVGEPAAGQPDSKRPRNDAPAQASNPKLDEIRAKLAANKAAVEARLAAARAGQAASTPPSLTPAATNAPAKPAGPSALPPAPTMDASVADKIAASKKRIEALHARTSNPYLSGSGAMPKAESSPRPAAAAVSSIALHPLLMGGQQGGEQNVEKNEKRAMRDRYKPMAPKFSSVKANVGPAGASSNGPAPSSSAVINPYASSSTANPAAEETIAPVRRSRKMHFAPQGKYVAQGDELRNALKMEALKQRIADASKKAGLDNEFNTLERSLKRQPPPEVEWWDKAILPDESNYDDIDNAINWITTSQDSLVTHLIQHPIPIPAPSDRKTDERGLMLTKKEQKKMRRQRRKAELEDKRDRQKMGLLPPDAPKANLMKVLTSDAVQDPTKVEAKVRREVAQRADKHERDNEDRKLTVEERQEKDYQKMLAKERKGIYAAVFKVKYLSNGRHKFKVRETAKKDHLSGVCIFNPNFALVLVEGVDKGIKHYKQLLLNRIDWTEQARPLGEGEGDDDEADGPAAADKADGDSPDMADNKCELIWEGEVPERTFKQFRARHSESDTSAKQWLTPKWEGMWDLAKRYAWDGEDL